MSSLRRASTLGHRSGPLPEFKLDGPPNGGGHGAQRARLRGKPWTGVAFISQVADIFSCRFMSRPVVTLMHEAVSRFALLTASGPSIA